MSGVYMDFSI